MGTDDGLREQMLNILRNTTERRFEWAVKDFPEEFVNARPPNVEYTPWHLIEHMRVGQWDILEYIRKPGHVSPNWPNEYWPPQSQQADADTWRRSVDTFRADRKALEELIADPATDLLAPLPHTPGHTVLREALLVVGHTAFHVGEFAILRQVMQTWPPDRDQ